MSCAVSWSAGCSWHMRLGSSRPSWGASYRGWGVGIRPPWTPPLCVHTPHHALGDAVTTGEVFLATVSRLEREDPGLTARTLVEISRRHSLT